MAFKYLARARAGMTQEAVDEGRPYQLRRSQLLRDRLLGRLLRLIEVHDLEPATLRAVAQAITAACKLLDSRDRSTQDLFQAIHEDGTQPAGLLVAGCAARITTEELPADGEADKLLLEAAELDQNFSQLNCTPDGEQSPAAKPKSNRDKVLAALQPSRNEVRNEFSY